MRLKKKNVQVHSASECWDKKQDPANWLQNHTVSYRAHWSLKKKSSQTVSIEPMIPMICFSAVQILQVRGQHTRNITNRVTPW